MPFGLRNAPATFQRLMNHVLRDEIAEGFVVVYMDDILIYSPTWKEHLRHMERVLEQIKIAGLTISPDECGSKEVLFLGHVLIEEGIRPNPEKTEAISQLKPPKCKKDIQTVMGLVNYYRRFVKDFSKIARPTNKLLKDDQPWESGDQNKKKLSTQ